MENDAYGLVLKYLLQGDAVVIVGSGASAEMGYPTWVGQLKFLQEMAEKKGLVFDEDISEAVKTGERLPSAFEVVEKSMGRAQMLRALQAELKPTHPNRDSVYNALAKSPFSLYLTTNYDDELKKHLKGSRNRKGILVLGNTEEDFRLLTKDRQNAIFKIHGSLTDSADAVVTQKDYDEFTFSQERSYYRKALARIFCHRHVVIIGYSIKDPDIRFILNQAKSNGLLNEQICLFASGLSRQEQREMFRQMNVVSLDYSNPDGTHSGLKKIMGLLLSFYNPSTSTATHSEDSKNAASLYVFRTLQKKNALKDVDNLVLLTLSGEQDAGLSRSEIAATINVSEENQVFDRLLDKKLISERSPGSYVRTAIGDDYVKRCNEAFELSRRAALSSFIQEFGIVVTSDQEKLYKELADRAIAEVFDVRGLEVTRNLFKGESVTSGELSDIYNVIAKVASVIQDQEHKWMFIRGVRQFLIAPTNHQKDYLVALSQGFFLYHMIGGDNSVVFAQRKFIENAEWFIDSHVLQALVATGCERHGFTKELFEELKKNKANLYVTQGTLDEVIEHFNFACVAVEKNSNDKALYGVIQSHYNFFIDGYIQSKAMDKTPSFEYYARSLAKSMRLNLADVLGRYGIKIFTFDKSDIALAKKYQEMIPVITDVRLRKNRVEPKKKTVETDSEIFVTITSREDAYRRQGYARKVYFLSDSTVFDRGERKIVRWSDSSLYRFVKTFSRGGCNAPSMYDCLHSEMMGTGLRMIDVENYTRFFAPEINTAKLRFKEECDLYGEQLENDAGLTVANLKERFEDIPDLQKPAFVAALDLAIAKKEHNRAEEEEKLRKESEAKIVKVGETFSSKEKDYIDEIERLKKELRKTQVELNTERNLRDPKHVVKRQRQLKRALRKKR